MSIYMIIESQVRDAALYGQYLQSVAPMVERYGGRYLARGGKVTSRARCGHQSHLVEGVADKA